MTAADRLDPGRVRPLRGDDAPLGPWVRLPTTATAHLIPASSGGLRLRCLFAPDVTPRAFTLASPKRDEREVGVKLLERASRAGGEILLSDKGYAGRRFAEEVGELDATIIRPARKGEGNGAIHLAPIRQRVESIFWTCKDILTLERHGAPAPWRT